MFFGDDVLHARQAALDQLIKHGPPARAGFTRAQPEAQVFPIALTVDADRTQLGGRADMALAPHVLDMGIDDQIAIRLRAE